jgi:hypothetical protein
MSRDIYLGSRYFSILKSMAIGDPENAYRQWIKTKSPTWNLSFRGHLQYELLPQMTPEEESEWLYWYKILWPQLEDRLNSVVGNGQFE